MNRTYEYEGFSLEVGVESDLSWQQVPAPARRTGFVATARVFQAGQAVALFSPLRFGDTGGRPFITEADALMGGYSATKKIVDDISTSRLISPLPILMPCANARTMAIPYRVKPVRKILSGSNSAIVVACLQKPYNRFTP
ncbi:hypothetical protein P3T18_001170 [Paraburkholderia sp. GAS199]|uniref:hypothetical protein n=1 Tax=Paraburkholderia sp. GAS199 TaxID=3035126 RepID=UPI003D217EC1